MVLPAFQQDFCEWESTLELRQYLILRMLPQHSDPIEQFAGTDLFTSFGLVLLHLCSNLPEPFGRTLIEAGAVGKPAIAFNMGGPAEIIQHGRTGFLIDYFDFDRLVDATLKLVENQKLRERMGQAAKAHVGSSYSMDKIVDNIQTCLFSVAGG